MRRVSCRHVPLGRARRQFAIALLCLEPECPVEWACHCNVLRARYNAPPPDHEQPTNTLNLADLRAHISRVTPPLQPND